VPLQCSTCSKCFLSRTELRLHEAFKHRGEKLFVCEECGHRASSRNGLQMHIKAKHRYDVAGVHLGSPGCASSPEGLAGWCWAEVLAGGQQAPPSPACLLRGQPAFCLSLYQGECRLSALPLSVWL